MRLPDEIVVEVRGAEDGRPIEGVLVWLDTFALNREHYRTVVGLTDRQGRAKSGGAKLLAEYRRAQHDFPMDYKLGPEDWDERIAIGVQGGKAFASERRAARESGVVAADYIRMWEAARNDRYGSVDVRVEGPDLKATRLRIELLLPKG